MSKEKWPWLGEALVTGFLLTIAMAAFVAAAIGVVAIFAGW